MVERRNARKKSTKAEDRGWERERKMVIDGGKKEILQYQKKRKSRETICVQFRCPSWYHSNSDEKL